jgi:hypothetical protein
MTAFPTYCKEQYKQGRNGQESTEARGLPTLPGGCCVGFIVVFFGHIDYGIFPFNDVPVVIYDFHEPGIFA